ncbi:MAG TPA: hypothetical protein VI076_15850 [Actinopolymorphaceae bacterium]
MSRPLHVLTATEAGDPALGNEDALIGTPELIVVLDGVTPLDRTSAPCVHGLRWYVDALAHAIAEGNRAHPQRSLADLLAAAIDTTRRAHVDTCDLGHVDAPAATVAIVRLTDDRLEHLVLADAAVVLELDGREDEPEVVVDDRPAATGRRLRAEGIRLPAGEFRSRWANRPGGYWVAAADPSVVEEALTGSVPLADVRRGVVASDGATRLVDTFARYTWAEALDVIESEGPRAWLARTRAVESDPAATVRGKRHDDATIALLTREPRP